MKRINESQLRAIVAESVKRVLNETQLKYIPTGFENTNYGRDNMGLSEAMSEVYLAAQDFLHIYSRLQNTNQFSADLSAYKDGADKIELVKRVCTYLVSLQNSPTNDMLLYNHRPSLNL